MIQRHRIDLGGRGLSAPEAEVLAAALTAGALVEARVMTADGAGELLEEVVALQRAHFDPAADSYSQLLVAEGRTIFNWGTAEGDGAEPVDLGDFPRLGRVVADAAAVSRALSRPGEAPLLSVVPSIRRTRTFPRFYHRDSHTSVAEVAEEATAPSSYRMVWDLGLVNSHEVLDVDFVPRRALLDGEGRVRAEFRHLFQAANLDFRAMSDAEIDAVQPQMREETLPFPEDRVDLLPGVAFLWLDDLFFHTTYLRRGRSVAELAAAPRSILIVREMTAEARRTIPWPDSVRRLLPPPAS